MHVGITYMDVLKALSSEQYVVWKVWRECQCHMFPEGVLEPVVSIRIQTEHTFWEVHVCFDRRSLSLLGLPVSAHFRCAYNLTEAARYNLLCNTAHLEASRDVSVVLF